MSQQVVELIQKIDIKELPLAKPTGSDSEDQVEPPS
jgi:hypothetical protein